MVIDFIVPYTVSSLINFRIVCELACGKHLDLRIREFYFFLVGSRRFDSAAEYRSNTRLFYLFRSCESRLLNI